MTPRVATPGEVVLFGPAAHPGHAHPHHPAVVAEVERDALPRRAEAVLVLGQEGPGISPEMLAACDVVLEISQFGSTRSINAGAAAAIAMHAWVRRHVFGQKP